MKVVVACLAPVAEPPVDVLAGALARFGLPRLEALEVAAVFVVQSVPEVLEDLGALDGQPSEARAAPRAALWTVHDLPTDEEKNEGKKGERNDCWKSRLDWENTTWRIDSSNILDKNQISNSSVYLYLTCIS